MKKFPVLIILLLAVTSCTSTTYILKDKISIDQLLSAKVQIDSTQNPAEAFLLKNSLADKVLVIDKIKVKTIAPSTNVDYDFCVISDLQTDKGPVEFYIYTRNVRRLSQLKENESVISVKGEFSRFFSMLDNYYTKIEVVNSLIEIQ